VVTAGNKLGGGYAGTCSSYGADGTMPDFAKGVMTTCEPTEGDLKCAR